MPKTNCKSLIFLVIGLSMAGCAPLPTSSIIRATLPGEQIALMGGRITAPTGPWGIVDYRNIPGNLMVLTTADFPGFFLSPLDPVLSIPLSGPIGSGPWTGNEMILVSSRWFPPTKLPKSAFLEETKQKVKDFIVRAYNPTVIEDKTSDYKEKLKFWDGYMFAMGYKAHRRDWQVVHAFSIQPHPKEPNPDIHIVHDFSYILMEKPGTKDHFDDFVALLKSIQLDK